MKFHPKKVNKLRTGFLTFKCTGKVRSGGNGILLGYPTHDHTQMLCFNNNSYS